MLIDMSYMASKEKLERENTETIDMNKIYEKQLLKVKDKKNKLLEAYMSDLITKDKYEEKLKDIKKEKIDTKKRLENAPIQADPFATLEQTKKAFITGLTAQKDFLEAKDEKKTKVLNSLLWNFSLSGGEIANVKYKPVYELIANSPKNISFSKMWAE